VFQDILIYVLPIFFLIVVAPILLVFTFQKNQDKKIQKNLNVEIETLNNLLEKSNDALFVIDIINGSLLKSNYRASLLLNYSIEELLTKTIFDLHPPDKLIQSSEKIADAWEHNGLIYDDLPFITSDGEILPVECSTNVVTFDQRPTLLLYARDIRQRLKLQSKILDQNKELEEINKETRDSIVYAQRIQRATLPNLEKLRDFVKDYFVFFQPKDIVSGDFYWMQEDTEYNTVYLAAVDCTGHGVPGAMMSMIGNLFLKQIIRDFPDAPTDMILNILRKNIILSLNQASGENQNKDGMDMTILKIDKNKNKLSFSGANNPIYFIRNDELIVYKGNPYPIGIYHDWELNNFDITEIEYQEGDCLYMFSDGFPDQFGGPKSKKYMYSNFKKKLLEIHKNDFSTQKEILIKDFYAWKGNSFQVDDVLVIGLGF
jgi:PAS domain S-box-containing protein